MRKLIHRLSFLIQLVVLVLLFLALTRWAGVGSLWGLVLAGVGSMVGTLLIMALISVVMDRLDLP